MRNKIRVRIWHALLHFSAGARKTLQSGYGNGCGDSASTDYNTVRPHSSISFLPLDEFAGRWNENEGFKNRILGERNRKIARILKNRIEKERSVKKCLIGRRNICPK